ncbi:hypothetical protein [Cellulomonas sp. B6]|uniref:hypothetical protein n=1 Tax=Cellulomonas sp. B6 TaxID=1295626 RepID=UPI00073CD04B|nr:hypothetical protein [Cellulomonas sp. B6]KSW28998.1 hypothetical protein ATM99_10235 [Cellulomonas sp. B6]
MRVLSGRLSSAGRDRGSALVSAVAVALIGIALASVVIASVIQGARDSGEDRARTAEVHTAEGAVDAVFAELETATPCAWPASGSYSGGGGPSATSATASIAYFDDHNNALTCTAGVLSGVPASAVVTAVADSTATDASRAVQTKVNLTPLTIDGRGAAIFASGSIMTTNSFTLETTLPDTPVDVWVDTGDVNCNSNVKIDGNLIVVQGKTEISGACRVTQDLWSKQKLTVHGAQSAGLATVGQDTYVASDATLAGGSRYGRDLIVAGSVTTWGAGPQVAGTTRTGVGAAGLPQYQKVGLPEVNYIPSDWVGFVNSGDRAQAYKDWVTQNAHANNAETWSDPYKPDGDKCRVAGDSWSLKGPLVGPTVPTIFDTRFCSQTRFEGNLNIKLRADLVIFASDFYATGNFQITSADGNQHRVWIIVPDPDATPNGVAECNKTVGSYRSGNIKFDSGSIAVAPITFFGYTPCSLETNNTMTFYGQLYGKDVVLRNNMTMRYVPIGIPGVDLPSTNPTVSSGYRVDVVYKREVKAP